MVESSCILYSCIYWSSDSVVTSRHEVWSDKRGHRTRGQSNCAGSRISYRFCNPNMEDGPHLEAHGTQHLLITGLTLLVIQAVIQVIST